MARVVAYIPDLMFGSHVQAALRAAGHTVELVGNDNGLRRVVGGAQALVVDLTVDPVQRSETVESLSKEGLLDDVRTLAFYSHVEADTRARAQEVGFDLIVPRSRMAREGPLLVTRLLESRRY
jgi:hypothetical protein